MKASKHAHVAADYITSRGWWRGDGGYGPGGQACLLGALAATDTNDAESDSLGAVYTLISQRVMMPPTMWNDHHAQDKGEVVAMLHWAGFVLAEAEAETEVSVALDDAVPAARVAEIVLDETEPTAA